MNRRIGIVGGTFDPIHIGHLDAAEAAREALGLDRIMLVPSFEPPHRPLAPQASPFHRFAMTALTASGMPSYEASDLELQAGGPSYTIDTLGRLQRSGFTADELFFVTGADAFAEIATWKGYPDLMREAHFVVVSRPGHAAGRLGTVLPALSSYMRGAGTFKDHPTGPPSIVLVERPTADVSSTAVRQACAEGRPLDGLVPALVAAHILRHGLYGVKAAFKSNEAHTGPHGQDRR
jgi:nicotinate-nucleotide adenylyltransferase